MLKNLSCGREERRLYSLEVPPASTQYFIILLNKEV